MVLGSDVPDTPVEPDWVIPVVHWYPTNRMSITLNLWWLCLMKLLKSYIVHNVNSFLKWPQQEKITLTTNHSPVKYAMYSKSHTHFKLCLFTLIEYNKLFQNSYRNEMQWFLDSLPQNFIRINILFSHKHYELHSFIQWNWCVKCRKYINLGGKISEKTNTPGIISSRWWKS